MTVNEVLFKVRYFTSYRLLFSIEVFDYFFYYTITKYVY